MNISDRVRASQSVEFRGNNFDPSPSKFQIDRLAHIKSVAGRDPDIRPAAVAALKAFHRRDALINGLSSIVSAREARVQLAELDFSMTNDEFAALFAIDGSAQTAHLSLTDRLSRLNVRRLEEELQPHVDRVNRAAIAAIRADLDRVDEISGFLGKFGAAPDELRSALAAAADKIEQDAAQPFNTNWHYDKRIALCQCLFPDDAPLVLDEPTATPSAATPAPAGTLRTAAAIAQSK